MTNEKILTIGQKIKFLRQSTGLSQVKFGEALGGIPLRTIQSWEIGVRIPPEWVVELIVYRVTTDSDFPKKLKKN